LVWYMRYYTSSQPFQLTWSVTLPCYDVHSQVGKGAIHHWHIANCWDDPWPQGMWPRTVEPAFLWLKMSQLVMPRRRVSFNSWQQ